MKLLTKSAIALLMAGGLATPVLAANTTQTNDPKTSSTTQGENDNNNSPHNSIRQQLRDNLGKAGFTDIKVMPESFLVRAKDSSGNPVMMVVNPDSVTAVTQLSAPADTTNNSNSGQSSGAKVMSGKNANGDPTPPAKQ